MTTITIKDGDGVSQTVAKVANTGQTTMSASLPVAIASDQTALPISAAALPLPTDAATQTTLAAVKTAVDALGVLLTSLDGKTTAANTGAVTVAGSALPTGAATEATLAAQSAKLPAALGPQAGSASLSTVESVPTTVTIVSLQTSATGATFVAFASQACEQLDVVNTHPTAVDLEVRRGGSGNTIIVPAGSSRMFVGLSNASGLQVRRLDQSNTQVTFTAEAIKA